MTLGKMLARTGSVVVCPPRHRCNRSGEAVGLALGVILVLLLFAWVVA